MNRRAGLTTVGAFLARNRLKLIVAVSTVLLLPLLGAGAVQFYLRRIVVSEIDKEESMWPDRRPEMMLSVFGALEERCRKWGPQGPPGPGELRDCECHAAGEGLVRLSNTLSLGVFDSVEDVLAASEKPAHRFIAVEMYGLYPPWDRDTVSALRRLARDEDGNVADAAKRWLSHIATSENGG